MTGATAEAYGSLSLHGAPIIRNGLLPSQDRKFIFITSEDQVSDNMSPFHKGEGKVEPKIVSSLHDGIRVVGS